jgi:hypothetical protein
MRRLVHQLNESSIPLDTPIWTISRDVDFDEASTKRPARTWMKPQGYRGKRSHDDRMARLNSG